MDICYLLLLKKNQNHNGLFVFRARVVLSYSVPAVEES